VLGGCRFCAAHDGGTGVAGERCRGAAVAADVESALERIVDEAWSWQHTSEGDGNPWAHVRAALTGSSVTIPVTDGALALGEFQSLFLCEFDGPRERTVRLTPL
jgi:secondary thiamine-phosphate synthase enzyme